MKNEKDSMEFTKLKILIWTVILTVVIEGITAFFRFGLHMESTRDTASTVGVITGGIRIHHGYIGLLMLIGCLLLKGKWLKLMPYCIIIGSAMVLSDLIHHFLVLWPITGSHDFDIFYRN